MKKLTAKFWLSLTIFSFMGQIAWVVENMYLNVFIYKMFNASALDISNMVAASAIAATLTTIFIGALSDKIGKRKLFICTGYILWGISILGFSLIRTDLLNSILPATVSAAAVGVSLVIILDCLMTFFGSSANDAAFNAWLTDSTSSESRGKAEGINAIMPLIAMLAVFGGFMAFDLNRVESWTSIFTIIGVLTLFVGILGFFIIEDTPVSKAEDGYLKTVFHGFMPSTLKANKQLYLTLFFFVIVNVAVQIFMPYLIIYYEVGLGMTDYVFVLAPAIVVAAVATALWGRVYDKKGYSFTLTISIIFLMAGCFSLFFAEAKAAIFVATLILMCGYLMCSTVFGAGIRDLTPNGSSGRFQGVRICCQVLLPGVIGPYIGRLVLADAETIVNSDGTVGFIPNSKIFLVAFIVSAIALLLYAISIFTKKPSLKKDLKTPYEEDTDSFRDEYPRPQMRRESYISLCGSWELKLEKKGNIKDLGCVTVPFPPPSRLSGIDHELKKGETFIYEKTFEMNDIPHSKRVYINFGAVDDRCLLYVNGTHVGNHTGGYIPFSFDITDQLNIGVNKITLRVEDPLDKISPYGKQRRDRGGMWYTPISGIWQPVWLEVIPEKHVSSIKLTPTLNSVKIETIGGCDNKRIILHLADGDKEYEYSKDSFELSIEDPILWTPDTPHLYTFTLICGEDSFDSYFALRTVSIESRNNKAWICLNGSPIFCHGLLDQGYFSDGIYLPASPRGYEDDILRAKSLGFNMLRKHIKIEPELFYYYCDKLGMLVFQDMVNNGKYSFLIDTALPTIGLKKGITHRASKERRAAFETTAKETQSLLYNHPSVILYTVFNEGWGQYDADRIYREMKSADPTRLYDATSGWFTEKESDFQSEHIYFRALKIKKRDQRPLFLSEFGGYSLIVKDHVFNLDKNYGYSTYKTSEELTAALESLYRNEVIPLIDSGLCATVLTQLSDVEDETNGILTYDRQITKPDTERIKAISEELYLNFEKKTK